MKITKYPNKGLKREFNQFLKSDSRRRGEDRIGECMLCGNESVLELGHVLPKWAYRLASDKSTGNILGYYPSIGVETIEQDGNKHYMFCRECEQYFGDAEKYAKNITKGSDIQMNNLGISKVSRDHSVEFFGVDIALIERFTLSLVLRAHLARSAPFHLFGFPDDIIYMVKRELVFGKDGGLRIFQPSIMAFKMISKIDEGIDPSSFIFASSRGSDKTGDFAASFLIGGWEWHVFLMDYSKFINLENNPIEDEFIFGNDSGSTMVFEKDIMYWLGENSCGKFHENVINKIKDYKKKKSRE